MLFSSRVYVVRGEDVGFAANTPPVPSDASGVLEPEFKAIELKTLNVPSSLGAAVMTEDKFEEKSRRETAMTGSMPGNGSGLTSSLSTTFQRGRGAYKNVTKPLNDG